MRRKVWLTGLVTAAMGVVGLTAAPAQAADEWTGVTSIEHQCDDSGQHERSVHSSVRGESAVADFLICWNNSFTKVGLYASAQDLNGSDGYHAEARIRYQVKTSGGWSDWHYRAPAVAVGPGAGLVDARYVANQTTRNVQAAACLYNGSTLIDCDDAGWQ
jgi:hypothetical protein